LCNSDQKASQAAPQNTIPQFQQGTALYDGQQAKCASTAKLQCAMLLSTGVSSDGNLQHPPRPLLMW